MKINFYSEDCVFDLKGKTRARRWLTECIEAEGGVLGEIAIVFCSDDYLLAINREYLKHDYFTDIITFDYSENGTVSGDLMISIDTVRSNAEKFGAGFDDELWRVMVHGVLHLLGYGDKTPEEETRMHALEDKYLSLRG